MATGTVIDFDEAKGWGHVRDDAGAQGDGGQVDGGQGPVERFFHCTAIADGTRTIEVDARVTYEIVAGRQGRWEAADLRPR